MKIFINGKEAAIKKDSSFEFIAENRSFTGSDGYTLSITFPLRGCPQNVAIFGNIARADVDKSKIVFDCEIHERTFAKYGAITIVEVNDIEVKTQFLEGRSEQNFNDTFDEIYINELDLGSYPLSSLPSNPSDQWKGLKFGQDAVPLPWVNNSSGNIQNEVTYDADSGKYSYHSNCKGLSYQPYLIAIVKRICKAIGYSIDLSLWDSRENLRYLIVCNTLPYAWDMPQFARALPHWNLTEFFEKLELFLGAEFDIDHKHKNIDFSFTADVLSKAEPVSIDKVIDEYSVEVSEKDESNYIESANIRYSECDHPMWKFYSCHWFIEQYQWDTIEYDSIDELIRDNQWCRRTESFYRNSNANKILYARDIATYFVIRSVGTEFFNTSLDGMNRYYQKCVLQPVNVFGDSIIDKDSENEIEIDFVPAWIDHTEDSKGHCLFLDVAEYDEEIVGGTRPSLTDKDKDYYNKICQPISTSTLESGEKEEKAEYFDKIYIAYWDGESINEWGKLPCPVIDWITIREDWTSVITHFSMRINNWLRKSQRYSNDAKQKVNFKYIAEVIPNTRSLFFIKGKKYLCEKITATFTEDGMSQLLSGDFYKIVD